MSIKRYILASLKVTIGMGMLLVLIIAAGLWWVKTEVIPTLPDTSNIRAIQLQVPLRIYSSDGQLLAEFAEERRIPLRSDEIPPLMVKAILAAEDDRFYKHSGVDYKGLMRAALELVRTGEKRQGGSTITMQLTRNLFLDRSPTFWRKFREILLAWEIEKQLSKDEILELYLNKIFLGHRAYGVGVAAEVYYGKSLQDLTLAEYAMIAAIPKAPSTNNPVSNPKRALERRGYVLRRMYTLGYIEEHEYLVARQAPNTAKLRHAQIELEAPYIAEMARDFVVEHYGADKAYTQGYNVYTTINPKLQIAARNAVQHALYSYDERHGYRGALGQIELPAELQPATADDSPARLEELAKILNPMLKSYAQPADLLPSVVLQVKSKSVIAYNPWIGQFEIKWQDLKWARRYINDYRRGSAPRNAHRITKRGDVIFVRQVTRKIPKSKRKSADEATPTEQIFWRLASVPQISGAIVSINPEDGSILSLIGGFDFYHSKFNRVTQAQRQPGSNFKPFIYSAALEHGWTAASMINDAPIVIRIPGSRPWRPKNYGKKFYGPTSLRKALTFSRNLVSIRLLEKIEIEPAIEHVALFGFEPEKIPKNFTISLGTSEVTPLELARAYAVLANGGYLIDMPHVVERIEDHAGNVIFKTNPAIVCRKDCESPPPPALLAANDPELLNSNMHTVNLTFPPAEVTPLLGDEQELTVTPRYAPQTIRTQNTWIMTSILKDVIKRGTGRRALRLKRSDIAGKTGTTNGPNDAWFSGYTPDIVTTAWVGFDKPRPLGYKETGGRAALPMWIDYMKVALEEFPEHNLPKPSGLTRAKIDPRTGLLARRSTPNAVYEVFFTESVPKRYTSSYVYEDPYASAGSEAARDGVIHEQEQLF